jgi:hypothetical protein
MNIEKNTNNLDGIKKEIPNQEETKAEERIQEPTLSEMNNYSPEDINEELSEDIHQKIKDNEYLADNPELMEKSLEAGDKINQELIQKHLEDTEKYKDKEGFFTKLQKNKIFKASSKVILAYMLFFKGYDAFAGNDTEKDEVNHTDKTEIKSENSNNNESSKNTYNAKESDFNNNLDNTLDDFNIEKSSVLDIDQYFEHNQAEINEEGQKEVVKHTLSFFEDMLNEKGEIDKEKLRDFLNASVKIKASANELQRIGGNEELAMARGEALKQIIDRNLENISNELKNIGLDETEIKKITDKLNKASIEIPEPKNGEKGVTYITDMENPETGKNYTEEEVNKLKENEPEKYQELLAEARSVKIDLKASNQEDISKINPKTADLEVNNIEEIEERKNILKPTLEEMAYYQEVLIANDNSPSTSDDNESMVNKIHKNFNDIIRSSKSHEIENIKVASFSDDLDKVKSYDKDHADKAFEKLYSQKAKGNSFEHAVDAATKFLDEADENKKSLLYINTDEKIQSASLNEIEDLKNKALEKNVDIKFLLKPIEAVDNEGNNIDLEEKYVEIDLEEIYNNVLDSYEEGVKKTIDSYKEYYKKYYDVNYDEEKIKELQSEKIEDGKKVNKDFPTLKLENGTKLRFFKSTR